MLNQLIQQVANSPQLFIAGIMAVVVINVL
jgi:uncharacterized membrane protein YgaE (UPF0421/DUF939 family)